MKNNFRSGDVLSYRLLFSLQQALGVPVQNVIEIKRGKWMLQTDQGRWFLKKYSTEAQLNKQLSLVSALLERGFKHVIPFQAASPIKVSQSYYALMPFVNPSPQPFSFKTETERKEALDLLSLFHQQTSSFSQQEKENYPEFNQISRWQHRYYYFQQVLSALSAYFPAELLARYAEMGQYSLKNLKERVREHSQTAIIHGDVASHNFFRGEDQQLYLIDFDLSAKAHPMYDYMQWMNRVLPLVDWEVNELWRHQSLYSFQFDEEFLSHLMFPTDIFRECKRFIQANKFDKQNLIKQIHPLIVDQYPLREAFFVKLATDLEK